MQRALVLVALAATPIIAHATPRSAAAPLAGAGETPTPAAAVEPGERVEVRTSDDLKLTGSYFEAKGRSDQLAPGCVLVHDAGGDRRQMDDVADRLQRLGFAVLALDLRGHGDSRTAGLDWSALDEGARSALWALAARDVEAGARWLAKVKGVHSTNLSLVGFGAGCALAVRQATRDENVRCIALLGPRSREFGFDVEADLKDLGGLPTLVLAPRPAEETQRMVEAANQVSHPYIELVLCTSKTPSVLEDKKTPAKVASWVKDMATPKKGRG